MAKRFRKGPALTRRTAKREPKLKLVIVCEGENTEPKYLQDFANDHANPLVEIETIKKGGVPVTLVNKAVKRKKELEKQARRTKNSFDKRFQVWGLFDVDEHPNIPQAKDKAHGNGVKLGISNPCFELWGLLHICNQDAPIHRHKLQRLLEEKMPSYDHDSSATFDYNLIRENYDIAKQRAIKGLNRRKEEDDPEGNPSTNVYELLDIVSDNGNN